MDEQTDYQRSKIARAKREQRIERRTLAAIVSALKGAAIAEYEGETTDSDQDVAQSILRSLHSAGFKVRPIGKV